MPPAAADFTISIAPSVLSASRGSFDLYWITITGTNGFTGIVHLSVSGVPARVEDIILPAHVTGSGSAFLVLLVGKGQPTGNFMLTVTGTSGALSHTATATLHVQ
jgi:hypothetical protein